MNIVVIYVKQDKRVKYICTEPFMGANYVEVKEGNILYLRKDQILVNSKGNVVTRMGSNNQRAYTKMVRE